MFSVFCKFFLVLLRLFTLLLRVIVISIVEDAVEFIRFNVVLLKGRQFFLIFRHFTIFRLFYN